MRETNIHYLHARRKISNNNCEEYIVLWNKGVPFLIVIYIEIRKTRLYLDNQMCTWGECLPHDGDHGR